MRWQERLRGGLRDHEQERGAAPTRLGEHEVLEELGRGGMGVVYRGRTPALGREVALKVLRPELLADERGLARFRREAVAVAGLRHPHVVRVHAADEEEGRPFIVMDLVEGESLRQRLERGPLPLDEALGIADALASALEAAHAAGVIHRDVKPSNVLFDGEGRPLLTDFGLARGLGDASGEGLTATGEVVGTPSFMAPEQAAGEAVDARADVYGLGATLFALLSGGPPPSACPGRSPPSVPHVPVAVARLCADCLSPAPADRPDLATVRRRLARLRAGASTWRRALRLACLLLLPPALAGLAGVLARGGGGEAPRPVGSRPVDSSRWVAEGARALANGEGEAAEEAFTRVLELEPESLRARVGRGRARLLTGDRAGAADDLRRAAGASTTKEELRSVGAAWVEAGERALVAGRPAAAEEAFSQAAAVASSTSAAIGWGWARLRRGDVRQAREAADAVLRRGEVGEAYLLRACARRIDRRELAGSRSDHDRAVALLGSAEALAERAEFLLAHQPIPRPLEAAEDCRSALALDPTCARALEIQAWLALRRGEMEAGRRLLQRAQRKRPSALSAYLQVVLLDGAGRYAEAGAVAARGLEADASSVDLHHVRGMVLSRLAEWSAAEAAFSAAIRLRPNTVKSRRHRADVRARLGKLRAALSDYDLAMKEPAVPRGLELCRVDLLRRLGRVRDAIEGATRLLGREPRFSEAYLSRALAQLDLGDLAGAQRDLDAFVRFAARPEQARELAAGVQRDCAARRRGRARAPERAAAARRLLQRSEWWAAITLLNDALRDDGRHADWWALRGRAFLAAGQAQEAAADANRALSLAPSDEAERLRRQALGRLEADRERR